MSFNFPYNAFLCMCCGNSLPFPSFKEKLIREENYFLGIEFFCIISPDLLGATGI